MGEAGGVVGEDPHHPDQCAVVGGVAEVEGNERGVCLRVGVDPGLVGAVEGDHFGAVEGDGCGGGGGLLVEGVVDTDCGGGADSGDSSSEEELSPGRPGSTCALIGRGHY